MKIQLKFFARLRERLGPGEVLDLPTGATVADARAQLVARGGEHADLLATSKTARCALDQVMCGEAAALHDGAELAFFPPVTGG